MICEHQYYVLNFGLVCSYFSIDLIFKICQSVVMDLAIKCANDAMRRFRVKTGLLPFAGTGALL